MKAFIPGAAGRPVSVHPVIKPGSSVLLKPATLWTAALLSLTTLSATADPFTWVYGTSGNFSDSSHWLDYINETFSPPDFNPLHRTPGAGDIVRFPQDIGAYTVQWSGTKVTATSIYDRFNGSLITLDIAGLCDLGQTRAIYTRLTGAGTVHSNDIWIYDSFLSGVRAEFTNVNLLHGVDQPMPALTLQDNSTLVTSDPLTVAGTVSLEKGSWTHTGIVPGGNVEVLNGSQFTVREAHAADAPSIPRVHANGGTVVMDHVQARVDAEGASSVMFDRAVLSSDQAIFHPAVFSGSGTTLTVSSQLEVTGGPLQFHSGARLQSRILQAKSSVEAIDTGSAINITDLLDDSTVTAMNGGSATVTMGQNAALQATDAGSSVTFNALSGATARVTATAGGVLSGDSIEVAAGQGSVRNAGSRLTLTGNLNLDSAQFSVEDGGRVDCVLAFFGKNGVPSSNATVSGPNSFLKAEGMILGDTGARSFLTVSSSGRVQVGPPFREAAVGIGFSGGAVGQLLLVDGGAFDSRSGGEIGVGIDAQGLISVMSGGRLLADNLSLGVHAAGNGLVTGSDAGSTIEVGGTLRVGKEGPGRMNLLNHFLAVAHTVHVGESASDNILTITGGAELRFEDALFVGHEGRGTVQVTSGGLINGAVRGSRIGLAEESSEATGTLTIDGPGSRVSMAVEGRMIVGTFGKGTLMVTNGGVLDLLVGAIGAVDGSTGSATVSGAGSQWNLESSLDVGGFAESVPGSLTVADGAEVRIGELMAVTRQGVVTLSGGGIRVGAGDAEAGILSVGEGGELDLGGRLVGGKVVQEAGGKIQPGNSPGIARMEGGFEQKAGAVLDMEIAGTAPGTLYDQIMVTGSAVLNGTLTVRFTNGFAPAAGQVFDLVVAGSITSSLVSATVEGLQPGFQHQLRTTADGRLQLVALNAAATATLPVTPGVSVEVIDGFAVVSWPPELTGWKLQGSPDLSPGSWTPVDVEGHHLTLGPKTGHRFFRLAQE